MFDDDYFEMSSIDELDELKELQQPDFNMHEYIKRMINPNDELTYEILKTIVANMTVIDASDKLLRSAQFTRILINEEMGVTANESMKQLMGEILDSVKTP